MADGVPVAQSPPMVEPSLETFVEMADGARLATNVYLPSAATSQSAWPFVLLRTPYGKGGVLDSAPQLAPIFNAQGIGLVAQDVRGKFASEGIAVPFRQEFADGLSTVEWMSKQSWCDSRVIPIGDSYAGFTAWCVAASGHPLVRGAVTCVTTCDIPSEWMYRQDVFRLQMNAGWATFAFGGRELPALPSKDPDWSVRPLSDLDYDGAEVEFLQYVIDHPPSSPEWALHNLGGSNLLSSQVDVPILHRGGWWDLMARGQVADWHAASARASGQILVMGGTDHLSNRFSDTPAECVTDDRAGQLTKLYVDEVMPFIASVLEEDPPASHVRWELVNDGWHVSPSWPPPDTRSEVLFLVDGARARYGPEGGGLSTREDTIQRVVSWTHDPQNLVPSLETFVWGTLAELPDERDAQVHDDVLTFSGPSMVAPLDIAGHLEVSLLVEASAPEVHVMATLCDVYPDGRAVRLAEGAAAVRGPTAPTKVSVDLGHLGYRLRSGHRLRLALSSSSFPRYLWSTGSDDDPWHTTTAAAVQVFVQLGTESFVKLDVRSERPA
jgi:predicted acyl esterase